MTISPVDGFFLVKKDPLRLWSGRRCSALQTMNNTLPSTPMDSTGKSVWYSHRHLTMGNIPSTTLLGNSYQERGCMLSCKRKDLQWWKLVRHIDPNSDDLIMAIDRVHNLREILPILMVWYFLEGFLLSQ